MTKNTAQTHDYYFQGIRYIPSYRDFDFDDATITAHSEEEAWDKLFKTMKYWKGVSLIQIDNKDIKKPQTALYNKIGGYERV